MKKIILSIIISLGIISNIFFINTINAENVQIEADNVSADIKLADKKFNTDIEILTELEQKGYKESESDSLIKTLDELNVDKATVMKLIKKYKEKNELNEAIGEIESFRDKYKVNESDMKTIYELFSEGYELHDIFYFYVIAGGVGERFDVLIKAEVLDTSTEDISKKGYDAKTSMNPYDIMQRYNSIKEANIKEKQIISNKFKLTENEIIACEAKGYTLSEAINAASMVKRYDLTLEEFGKLSIYYDNLTELEKILDAVKTKSKDLKNIDKKLIRQMLTEGYKLSNISRAYLAAEALDLDICKLIKKTDNYDKKVIKNNMEDEEYELLLDLEAKYSVDIFEIIEYMSKEKASLNDIYKAIAYYEYSQYGLAAKKSDKTSSSDNIDQSLTVQEIPSDDELNYNKYLVAPFKVSDFNKENINQNTGELNYNYSVLSLPGRNGLDLNIAASYDSSNSGIYDISYTRDVDYTYQYKLTIKGMAYWYIPWATPQYVRYTGDEADDTPEQVLYFDTEQQAQNYAASYQVPANISYSDSQEFTDTHENTVSANGKYNPWEVISTTQTSPAPSSKTINSNGYSGSIPRVEPTDNIYDSGVINGPAGSDGRLTWSRTQTFRANYRGTLTRYYYRVWVPSYTIEHVLYDYDIYYYNTTGPNTYTELHNNLGSGWSFNFSNIENMSDGSKYLHLGNGSSYKINITSTVGDSNLYKYPLKDMSLETDNGSYSNGQKSSSYVLIYKNGKKEYFTNDGRLLCIKDRYNNTIKFEHDTAINNQPLITKITDTLDRVTTIAYQTTATGKEVTITAPGEKITRLIIEPAVGYSGDYVLKKIIDPENRETLIDYNYQAGIFNFTGKTLSGGSNNVYVNLKEIKYPTGGYSRYTYQKTTGNLGNRGLYEYYRIETREDVDGTTSYNKNTYSYSNNFTGYGTCTDPNNLPSSYTYSTTIIDAKGNSQTNTYNNKHLLIKDEAKEGTTLLKKNEYTYYLDRLIASNISTLYNKLGGSRAVQQDWSYNDYGDLLKYTDANRNVTDYQYDNVFHLVSFVSKTLDDTGLVMNTYNDINTTNGNINSTRQQHIVNGVNKDITTTFTYDSYGNITDEVTTQTGENTIQKHYDYDLLYKNAYLTKKTATVTDYNGVSKTAEEAFEYDINTGELLKHTNANNKIAQYQYDKLGRRTLVINPEVTKQDNTVEATTVTIAYDDTNNKVTLTDENGHQLRVSYDTLGKEISKEELNNGVWVTIGQTKYNALSQIDYVLDANNNKTINRYDMYGRVIRTDYADLSYKETEYNDAFDTNSSLKTIYDEERNRHDYYYDNLGNLVKEVVYPDKADLNKQNITQYHYNKAGKADYVIDANNQRTSYKYDDLVRLISVTNALDEVTEYDYDILSNIKSIKDAKGNITSKKYDELGRLIEQTNQLNQKENWEYDNIDNLLTYIDKMNQTTTYTYNERNWLKNVTTGSISTSYEYDKAGNIKAVTDATGTVTYEYYDNGSLKSKKLSDNKLISYEYDLNKNVTKVTDYLNKVVDYTYDNRNRMKNVTVDGKTTTYEYYLNGSRKGIANEGQLLTEYTYNGDSKLLSIANKKSDNTILSKYTYTYDSVGNQLTKTDINNNITQYTYDLLNRIKTVQEQDTTAVEYSYDKNGNIALKSIVHPQTYIFNFKQNNAVQTMDGILSHTVQYTYNNVNQLTLTREEITNDGTENSTYDGLYEQITNFVYDNNGNMISKEKLGTADREQYTYNYNEINQLTEFIDPQNQATTYTYYADGLRSTKTTGANTTCFYYNNDEVILETLNGNLNARNILGLNEIARQDITGSLYYYQYNGHGDVVNLVEQTGNIQNTYDFDEFGKAKQATENGINNPLRYTGEYYDSESGMYYLRARYYDPEIARFISEDSYKGDVNDPLSLNLYTYCRNNPITRIDPSGHRDLENTSIYSGDGGGDEKLAEYTGQATSIGIGFTIFDTPKDILDFAAGKDILTGDKISRFALAGCIFGPEITDQILRNGTKTVTSALNHLIYINKVNGKYYAAKNVIDEIGKLESKGLDFSKFSKKLISSRKSTEGGVSNIYRYSDKNGVKFIIHEVTDAAGKIIHRDFDAVRIDSGQLINKLSK